MTSPTARNRSDRCPGVLRPWPAGDGALVRLRLVGGRVTPEALTALVAVAEEHGDGAVHLTSRGNLQVRALPAVGDRLAPEAVDAILATGLVPSTTHELVRNVMVSPLSGLLGGRADLREVATALDAGLCGHPSLARLPGRFLFVLDDGRGDLAHRHLDLGLVAVSATEGQLRLGSRAWGPVVPLPEAADRLVGLARAFLTVRGDGPTAAWHVDELDALPDGRERDPRTHVDSAPPPYGRLAEGLRHVPVPEGRLTGPQVDSLAGATELVVTPWRSIVVR